MEIYSTTFESEQIKYMHTNIFYIVDTYYI